jgi:photosystem I subunit X
MVNFSSLVIALATAERPVDWSIQVGLIMLTCNVFAFVVGRYAIKNAGASGMDLPAKVPAAMQGFGIPELLAVASFGHILGAGMILGLTNSGLL